MGYCPYYSKDCPHNNECELYRSYGCSAGHLPGTPAVYTDGAPVDVFIFGIYTTGGKITTDILIIYADATTGVIGLSDDITKFVIKTS